jgi:hypothetical protein
MIYNLMRSEAGVSKAYVIVTLMICMAFTGCIGDDEKEASATLKDSVYEFFDWGNTQDWRKWCSYILYTVEDNEIILANNTELNECAEMENDSESEYKNTVINYTEENLDYRAASNSGFVYSVSVTIETCERPDEYEPWDCDYPLDWDTQWVEVGGQWILWDSPWSFLEQGESAPIATFWVSEDTGGRYNIDVIKVSKQEDLAGFSFYLKDDTGSTYVGSSNGFGEIAMQIIDGEEHGIDTAYNGSDEQLSNRATNVSNDDGTEYPVHFNDNDSDGMLSVGDQFTVYGNGNNANGPATDDWRLDIQFDASGDIIGSTTMGHN